LRETRKVYRILVRKPAGKYLLGSPMRWEGNIIKMALGEMG
jgi:hypothetical protein